MPSSPRRVGAFILVAFTLSCARTPGEPPPQPPPRFTVLIGGGTGTGTVTGGLINCAITAGVAAGTCSASVPSETEVVLTAAAGAGHAFAGWIESGAVVSTDIPLSFTVTAHRTLAARFQIEGRAIADRPDDLPGPQVHVMYVLPKDGIDRALDVDGTLARSVASFHGWFTQRTQGLAIRFDRREGALDITFHRLDRTDAEISSHGAFVVTTIEAELKAAGRLHADKRYLVYYDGGSTYACGGAVWPPQIPGQVAAMYLKGTPGGASCASQPFVTSASQFPGYWEFAALHDVIHSLGIVAMNAPNHAAGYPAHVPEPHDLMYGGPTAWVLDATTTIDVGGDDYFGANVPPGVAKLANSPFITTVPLALMAPIEAPAARALQDLSDAVRRLPVHEPFAPAPPR